MERRDNQYRNREEQILLESLVAREEEQRLLFPLIEAWLKVVIIDPSFFFSENRLQVLCQLLEGIRPKEVIIPTDFYNVLSARFKRKQIIEYIEKEVYYPTLLEFVIQWEAPSRVKRQEILQWISSANFLSLLSVFLGYEVVPASKYLRDELDIGLRDEPDIGLQHELGSNPIDIKQATNILGKTAGRAFYEMVAVAEKTGRAVVSRTRSFLRLARKISITSWEAHPRWKKNFLDKLGIRGRERQLLLFFAATVSAAQIKEMLTSVGVPFGDIISGGVLLVVYDGPRLLGAYPKAE